MSVHRLAIATHSGLRGRPGLELTDEVVEGLIRGFVALLRERRLPASVAVARDERPGGSALAAHVVDVARSAGADVVDLGVASTPSAKLAARRRALGGAVVVTGSHLEPDWNGIKLAAAPLYGPLDVRAVPRAARPFGRRGRLVVDESAAAEHADAVIASVDGAAIRAAGIAAGWSGGPRSAADLVLERLACESGGAVDVRFLVDADGDRVQLADERDVELDSEATLGLAVLARKPRCLVKGADTSRLADRLVGAYGGRVVEVPTGELYLLEGVLSENADLAGEGNGGVMLPAVGLHRDGLAAAAAILELLARTGRALSDLAADLPQLHRRRSTVAISRREAMSVLSAAARDVGAPAPSDEHAGVRIERDGSWGLARLSATEPLVRLTAEAETQSEADALHAELRAAVGA